MVDRVSVVYALSVVFLLFHSTFQQQSPPLRSRTERFALIQLRSSLGLRSREWPIKADPCSNWVGVQCRNGRVIGINVSGFRRTRKGSQNPQFSVDALANFTLLESFNASKLFLPGPIPDWFGLRLGALQVLDLRSCSISGVIPTSLGNLTTLTGLYLSGNGLTGIVPPSLGQLFGLSVLDLSHNSFTGSIPSTFVSLVNLTSLDMSSNYFSGTINPAIGTLSGLQFLNLSNNSLASTIPPQLGDLSNLVDLDLSSNAFTGSVPADLRGLRNLQNLVLGNNLLSGSLPVNLFPTLTRLQTVSLNQNNISGNLPVSLWSLPALRLLDASRNSLEGTLPDISLNASTLPAVLNISQNMFYGNLTSVIKRFSLIDLSGNYFEGMVPDYARSNVSLGNNCLRVISSQRSDEECKSFYAKRNLPFDGNPNATQPPPPSKSTKKDHKWWIILVGAVGGALLAVLVIVAVLLIIRSCKRSETSQRGTGVGPVPTGENPPPPPGLSLNFSSLGEVFTYQQLLLATDNFNDVNLIKHGHSGDLFQGILEGGVPVAIKKVDLQTIKKESYLLELDVFSKVSHARLVPLLGHCLESEKENEKFLVYKYMPNGDLSSSLFRKTNSEDDSLQSLDWITRLKIAIGAAEGLSYLHHECTPPLVHRDVQASSILLDDKFEVRLGSLSEVCAQEGDAQQSMITRLLRLPPSEQGTSGSATATCTYDVYCFGKVLLELVTGKLGISASNESKTKEILEATLPYISIYDKELVTNILDPSLIIDEDLLEEVWAMAVVARSCLNPKPSRRPLMRYVLKALENPLKVVREENTSSARLRATSSRGSWNAALFGSWRSSSDVAAVKGEGTSSFKQFGTSASQGSGGHNGGGHNGGSGGGGFDRSSSTRRQSKEIFPEPSEERNVERSPED